VSENLKINPALLSRFDVIFILLDKADQQRDQMLSEHVIKMHSGTGNRRIPYLRPSASSSASSSSPGSLGLSALSQSQRQNARSQKEKDVIAQSLGSWRDQVRERWRLVTFSCLRAHDAFFATRNLSVSGCSRIQMNHKGLTLFHLSCSASTSPMPASMPIPGHCHSVFCRGSVSFYSYFVIIII